MKSGNWKGVVEFVGMFAIVGSLIFVGWQIKQEQDIALAEINLSLLSVIAGFGVLGEAYQFATQLVV